MLNLGRYDLRRLAIRQAMEVIGRVPRREEAVIPGLPAAGTQATGACSWSLANFIAHDLEQSRATMSEIDIEVAKETKYNRVSSKSRKQPMRTVSMREARTNLSRLVEAAAKGESFIIARAGKPMVKVVALDAPDARDRIGFLAGQITVPDDFDSRGSEEIRTLFSGRR